MENRVSWHTTWSYECTDMSLFTFGHINKVVINRRSVLRLLMLRVWYLSSHQEDRSPSSPQQIQETEACILEGSQLVSVVVRRSNVNKQPRFGYQNILDWNWSLHIHVRQHSTEVSGCRAIADRTSSFWSAQEQRYPTPTIEALCK